MAKVGSRKTREAEVVAETANMARADADTVNGSTTQPTSRKTPGRGRSKTSSEEHFETPQRPPLPSPEQPRTRPSRFVSAST